MSEQLQRELSRKGRSLSNPSPQRLRAWRLYFESALALVDVLDAELDRDAGIPLRWFDAPVHLGETGRGLGMDQPAGGNRHKQGRFHAAGEPPAVACHVQ